MQRRFGDEIGSLKGGGLRSGAGDRKFGVVNQAYKFKGNRGWEVQASLCQIIVIILEITLSSGFNTFYPSSEGVPA